MIERTADNHRGIIGRAAAFALGFTESGSDFGMTYDENPWSDRSVAYDNGRTIGQWVSRYEVASWIAIGAILLGLGLLAGHALATGAALSLAR